MSPRMGLNLRVTGHCSQGGRNHMEDAFVVAYQQTENQKDLEYAYFGIFDGHGGKEAALFAKEHLMNNIVCQKAFWSDDDSQVLKAIRNGYLATHHAMWKEVENWPKTASGLPSTSGTTCSVAFIRRKKLFIGHVGDSKIVLGFQKPGSNEWFAQALTKDHKPESPEERNRINNVGGLVMRKAGVDRVVWNRPQPGHKGPILRNTPVDQIPFLAVARSLGDLWSYNYLQHEFVVSPDPDVDVIEINPRIHRCIIFASDGLWNMLRLHAAVSTVQQAEEENEKLILEGGKTNGTAKLLKNPSKLLVESALYRWFRLAMRADNTSVVTVMLDPPGPPKSEVLMKQRVMKRLRPRDEQNEGGDEAEINTSLSECDPITKGKKRSFDCVEPSPLKDKKLAESSCKEKKHSIEHEDPMPKNLPKPVILSPHRVVKNNNSHDLSQNKSKSPDVSPVCSPTVDVKVKKSGHDPPNTDISPLSPVKKENNTNSSMQSDVNEQTGESSKSLPEENSKEKTNSNSLVKNELIHKSEEYGGLFQTNSSSKENGRIHLCEVDNFYELNNRTTECNDVKNSSKSCDLHKCDISPKNFHFRKITLRRRCNSAHSKTVNTFKKARLHETNISHCRTRAQSCIQKLKV